MNQQQRGQTNISQESPGLSVCQTQQPGRNAALHKHNAVMHVLHIIVPRSRSHSPCHSLINMYSAPKGDRHQDQRPIAIFVCTDSEHGLQDCRRQVLDAKAATDRGTVFQRMSRMCIFFTGTLGVSGVVAIMYVIGRFC